MKHPYALIFLLSLCACPDPTETPAADGAGSNSENPSLSTPNGDFESDPNEARIDCNDTECITVSGTFNVIGDLTGTHRVDVQKLEEGSAPRLVHTIELQSDGKFSFELPKGFGDIVVTGFIDQTGDGPTPDDAQGRINLEVLEVSITEVSLDVALGNAPPPPPQPGTENGEGSTEGTPTNEEATPPSDPPPEGQPSEQPPDQQTTPAIDGPPADDGSGTQDSPNNEQ